MHWVLNVFQQKIDAEFQCSAGSRPSCAPRVARRRHRHEWPLCRHPTETYEMVFGADWIGELVHELLAHQACGCREVLGEISSHQNSGGEVDVLGSAHDPKFDSDRVADLGMYAVPAAVARPDRRSWKAIFLRTRSIGSLRDLAWSEAARVRLSRYFFSPMSLTLLGAVLGVVISRIRGRVPRTMPRSVHQYLATPSL